MRKLDRRHAGTLLAFFTSLMMSFLMSMTITLINVGPIDGFFALWMRAFAVAFAVAFPLVLIVLPIARRLVDRVTA